MGPWYRKIECFRFVLTLKRSKMCVSICDLIVTILQFSLKWKPGNKTKNEICYICLCMLHTTDIDQHEPCSRSLLKPKTTRHANWRKASASFVVGRGDGDCSFRSVDQCRARPRQVSASASSHGGWYPSRNNGHDQAGL